MKFKASLDTLCKLITTITLIVISIFFIIGIRNIILAEGNNTIILVHSLVLAFLFIVILLSYLYSPQYYLIENSELIIVRPGKNKTIKLQDIKEIGELSDDEMRGALRIFGVGGLFGYYGLFYLPKIGKVTYYSTKRRENILIILKDDKKILLSPDDKSLIQVIKNKL